MAPLNLTNVSSAITDEAKDPPMRTIRIDARSGRALRSDVLETASEKNAWLDDARPQSVLIARLRQNRLPRLSHLFSANPSH